MKLLFNSLRDRRPGRGQKFSACSQNIAGQIIPSIPSPSRVSRIHQLLSPNPLPLFNSSSPATAQKPLPPIRHICGLGASVGCERIKRTFNTPRLKSQICLIGGNGFVCSVSNELNSNYPNATSSVSISVNPKENNTVPILLCFPADISGISSSTTT